jgi:hypothetical protein
VLLLVPCWLLLFACVVPLPGLLRAAAFALPLAVVGRVVPGRSSGFLAVAVRALLCRCVSPLRAAAFPAAAVARPCAPTKN